MADGLYDIDALAWSEEQAALLRRLASGERVNDLIDWPHVIEEVSDVGRAQLTSCRSLLRQAMLHLLKLHAWPESRSAAHRRQEAAVFLVDANDRYAPSMRQRIDLRAEYATCLRLFMIGADDSGALRPVPQHCPFDIASLLGGDVERLLRDLAGPD